MAGAKSSGPKFYAVRAGHKPGIYRDWDTCRENITGFRGAAFKSFATQREAEDFVAGRITSEDTTKQPSPAGPTRYYGIASGKQTGVFTSWTEAEKQIVGWKNPKYKKFNTKEEAEAFVKYGAVVPVAKKRSADSDTESDQTSSQPAGKRSKSDMDSPESMRVGTVRIKALEYEAQAGKGPLRIYTDGSSLGNGQDKACAGVGVFFGDNDSRNISEALAGDLQTNQRAELTAILRALQVAPIEREVHIFTDSSYSINCVTIWYKSWERRNWVTSQDKPVMNKDLIQDILRVIRARRAPTVFTWVRGHNSDPCNEAADRLAVGGAHGALLERRKRLAAAEKHKQIA